MPLDRPSAPSAATQRIACTPTDQVRPPSHNTAQRVFARANRAIARSFDAAASTSRSLSETQRNRLIQNSLENQGVKENRAIRFEINQQQTATLKVGIPYSVARRDFLGHLTQDQAQQLEVHCFGHRVAAPLHFKHYVPANTLPTQICSTEHEHSTFYHRDLYARIKPLLERVIQPSETQRQIQRHKNGEKMTTRLVSSPGIADRFNTFFRHMVPPGRTGARQFALSDGVQALLLPDPYGILATQPVLDGSSAIDNAYHFLGGPPSVKALMNVGRAATALKSNGHVDASLDLQGQLLPALNELTAATNQSGNGTGLVSAIAINLVKNLLDLQPHIHDNSVNQAIARQISNLLTGLTHSQQNMGACSELMDALYDEVNTLLNLSMPYLETQAHRLQEEIYTESLPCLKPHKEIEVTSEGFTGSGMQAISTALEHAVNIRKRQGQFDGINMLASLKLNYYETEHLTSKLATNTTSNILYSTLNPSSWTAKVDHDQLVQEVNKAVVNQGGSTGPIYLVLDATVDSGHGELNQLAEQLTEHLVSGKLSLLLCKSYQKYASLGSGKISMGNLTSVQSRSLPKQEFGTNLEKASRVAFRDNNGQLLTHLLKSNELSIKMIQAAADNARFVGTYCWPLTSREPVQYRAHAYRNLGVVNNLPFVFRRSLPDNQAEVLLTTQQVHSRMTFGFLESSTCGIGSMVRVNTGVESRERLVEKFFAMGQSIGEAPLDDSVFEAVTVIASPEAGQLLDISPEILEQALSMPNLNQIIRASEEAFLPAPQTNLIIDMIKRFRQPIGVSYTDMARFVRQYDANIRASIVLQNASLADLYPNKCRSLKTRSLHEAAKLIRDRFKGRAPGASELTPEGKQSILKRFLTHVANNFVFELSDQRDRNKILEMLKMTHANTRLNLLTDAFDDATFASSRSQSETDFQKELMSVLTQGIQKDQLADAGRLRLIKHSRNRSTPPGINLAKALAAKLRESSDEPVLTGDFQSSDLKTTAPSNSERDRAALGQLIGAIKLHDTLTSNMAATRAGLVSAKPRHQAL